MKRTIFTIIGAFISLFIMNAQETPKIKITVGTYTFVATTTDNATARTFIALLPMTVTMSELNGNEKFYQLSNNLAVTPERPSAIRAGDLMLYGQNTLVLFYETFTTSYSYTKIGAIDDPVGLKTALGTGSPTVTFERVGSSTGIGSIEQHKVDYNISPGGLLYYTGHSQKVSLMDINGKILASTSSNALRINDFPKGVYILKVEEGGQTKTIKIKI